MIWFILGLIAGIAVAWYVLRRRVAAYRRDRDYWWDIAEHRKVELKAADDEEKATGALIGSLRGEILQLAAEKTELNRLLDAHGVIR